MSRLFVLTAALALLLLPHITAAQAPAEPAATNPTVAWAQARLAEIDATVATLDAAARTLAADTRAQAETALQKLRDGRDAFRARIDAVLANGKTQTDAQVTAALAALDARWNDFERDLEAYLAAIHAEATLRASVFEARERAEETYWQQAIASLQSAEAGLSPERRSQVDAAIAALQSYADAAKARLARLQQAGSDAWAALRDGLADARRAFDNAYDKVLAAIARAQQ